MRARFFVSLFLIFALLAGAVISARCTQAICSELCDMLDDMAEVCDMYPHQAELRFSAFCDEYERVRPFLSAVCIRKELTEADRLIFDIGSALSRGESCSEILPLLDELKVAVYGIGASQRLSADTLF